jgi:type I restriction enzyme S subunit
LGCEHFLSEKKVSVNHINSQDYLLENGDVVLARTGASTGKSYLYNPYDGKLVFAGFLIRVKTNPNKLDPLYLKGFLKTKTYWDWVKAMSMRSGQPGINGNEYAQLPIQLPPTLKEQKAIATALSDVDALITSLDKLIAKKRNIKQGAMQLLLTGEKRLSGFGGEWEVKKLGEISEIKTGSKNNQDKVEDGLYPFFV